MKLFSSLSKSTIITLIACACFLTMVGMILLFLMMFPIDPKKYSAETPASTTQPVTEAETIPDTTEYVDDSSGDPHLSTWEAVIDGETKPIDEQYGDSRPDPDPVYTDAPPQYPENDVPDETELSSENTTDSTQMVTETMPLESNQPSDGTSPVDTAPPETDPVVDPQDPTEPPIVEPDPTDPPMPIPEVTDPPAAPHPAVIQPE